jgi:hypothetical protein
VASAAADVASARDGVPPDGFHFLHWGAALIVAVVVVAAMHPAAVHRVVRVATRPRLPKVAGIRLPLLLNQHHLL